jgi:uncharacterized protein (DUF433 family)
MAEKLDRNPAAMSAIASDQATLSDLVTSHPEVMGGRRVFRGTRVPIEVLFENLADGLSLEEILHEYETLDRADVVRVLELTSTAMARFAA